MKNLILLITFLFTSLCIAQKEKETVYLFFDITNNEKCKVAVEGKGYLLLNKYRKKSAGDFTSFYICDEEFSSHNLKSHRESIQENEIENFKIVDIDYIQKAKKKTILKYNPFNKIYLLERISKNKINKIEVTWIDDWIMTRD